MGSHLSGLNIAVTRHSVNHRFQRYEVHITDGTGVKGFSVGILKSETPVSGAFSHSGNIFSVHLFQKAEDFQNHCLLQVLIGPLMCGEWARVRMRTARHTRKNRIQGEQNCHTISVSGVGALRQQVLHYWLLPPVRWGKRPKYPQRPHHQPARPRPLAQPLQSLPNPPQRQRRLQHLTLALQQLKNCPREHREKPQRLTLPYSPS